MKPNKVYLVGAGPGEPGLITVKGQNILRQADVIIYDYLVDKRILEEARQGAELICCDKPPHQRFWCGGKLGKNRYSDVRLRSSSFGGLSAKALATADGFLIHQEKINNLIVKKAKEGKKVIRLKNGDPPIFSRLSQELNALVKHKIEFEIVPGVTAASGAACYSGIPLSDRKFASSVVFVTGHEDPTKKESALDWKSLARSGTIVLYMAVENSSKIAEALIKAGKKPNTPCAIIQDATLLTQKILTGTLKDIVTKAKSQKIKPPAIIVIGEVVKLEKNFGWLKKSKRILFTGLSKERFFLKGTYFHLPLVKIEPLKNYKEFDNYLENISQFDWIVFASRYGAEYFFKRFLLLGFDARVLSNIEIAAIGNSTKNRLLDFGVKADLVPKKESSAGLLREFSKIDLKGKNIFLPRSNLADKGLTGGLEKLGAKVTSSFAYRNVLPQDLPNLDLSFFDEIIFSSPSGVRNFVKRYGKVPKKVKVSCIGEVTRKEAKKWHLLG